MATIATGVDTLANWAKTRDPDGNAADIVELLNQSNEINTYTLWEEGNLPLGNRTSIRVDLPTVNTRQLGAAVATSTSREAQFDDSMALLEAWNEVDIKLANLHGDVGRYRLNKSIPYFEAFAQKFAYLFYYGDTTVDATQFFGMASRYATKTAANAANAQNVLDGGGTSTVNASMWLHTFGPRSLMGIFPRGSKAGLMHKDWGEVISQTAAAYPSNSMAVYKDQYTWDCGISLKDWRWNVRIANVDTTNLVNESGAADLLKLMIKAMYRLPSIFLPPSTTGNPMTDLAVPGRQVFVCNRTMREMLHIQALNKVSNQLVIDEVDGKKILSFSGIPILNCDQLTNSEAQVT